MRERFVYYFLAIIIAFSTLSGFMRLPSYFYQMALAVFLAMSLKNGNFRIKTVSTVYVLFIIICALSILYNNPPAYFKSWQRLALFVLVLLCFSPLAISKKLVHNRERLYYSLLVVMLFFTIASFFAYFLGINYFQRGDEILDMGDFGHFSGFFNHSMTLGPIGAITSVYSLSKYLLEKEIKHRLWWIMFFLISFSTILLSSSRGATAGGIFAVLIVLYRYSKLEKKRFAKYIGIVFLFALILLPVIQFMAGGLIQKQDANVEEGSSFSSRERKYVARIVEIQNHLITGIGFAAVDPNLDVVNEDNGGVEPGISWLSVFSMTGILGFSLFLFLYIRALQNAFKNKANPLLSTVICGVLTFYGVHMLTEGYILFGGNIMCGFYWLTLGVITCTGSSNIHISLTKKNIFKYEDRYFYRDIRQIGRRPSS